MHKITAVHAALDVLNQTRRIAQSTQGTMGINKDVLF